MNDTLLVSISNNVLIVGRKTKNETVKIVNAFEGDEALELYKKLTEKKGNTNE